MKKKIFIVLLVIMVIAIGFLRESVFVSINEKTGQGPAGTGEYYFWKWPLTIGFACLYFGATCLFLHLLFARKQYFRLTVFAYTLLFTVSIIASAVGYLTSSFENVYPFVRAIMGVAQSPIIMIILITACFLNKPT